MESDHVHLSQPWLVEDLQSGDFFRLFQLCELLLAGHGTEFVTICMQYKGKIPEAEEIIKHPLGKGMTDCLKLTEFWVE